MLASRLVKFFCFVAVSLVPIAAQAGFVIDNFDSFGTQSQVSVNAEAQLNSGFIRKVKLENAFSNTSRWADVGGPGQKFQNVSGLASGNGVFVSRAAGGTRNVRLEYTGLSGLTDQQFLDLEFGDVSGSVSLVSASADGGVSLSTLVGTVANGVMRFNVAGNLSSVSSLTFVFSAASGSSVAFDKLTATPEPTSLMLFGSVVAAGMVGVRRRMKGKAA